MAALWQRQGLPVRGPPQAQLDAANIEWMNASCDPVQLEGTAAASGEEGEEEEGPGVGGEVDDEVDEDEELVEAVEDVVAALGNPAEEGSDAGEGSDSSGGSGVGGRASSRASATGSSDGEGDSLPFVAGPDSSSDEEEGSS